MAMQFKAKIFEIEQGQNEVVLNENRAKELGIEIFERVLLKTRGKEIVAIVDFSERMVKEDEMALFDEVAHALEARNDELITLETLQRPASLDYIKKKLDGFALSAEEIEKIIRDVNDEKLSSTELAAFITAIYTRGFNMEETAALTNAICNTGDILDYDGNRGIVVSEHSIGGIAGDKSSMLIVPILASLGITIPKTASRAISSGAGTADCMEVLTKVALSAHEMQEVVKKTGGCLVWGGAVRLASADDKLIKIRKPLRLDPKPLLLASILAKKKAEGAQYVLIDIPCGKGAKVETAEEGKLLAQDFETLGSHLGMKVQCIISDGSEPMTSCAGPALEAKCFLSMLETKTETPLVEKSCLMVGVVLQMTRGMSREEGYKLAMQQFRSGKALEKFREIIEAQGGNPEVKSENVEVGKLRALVKSEEHGKAAHVDNKAISKICRMLGAPSEKRAGMMLRVSKGQQIEKGEVIAELFAVSQEKLDFALSNMKKEKVVEVERIIIDVV